MQQKKKIKALENRIQDLEKIIRKNCVVLTDETDTGKVVTISLNNGQFSIVKTTTITNSESTAENIINEETL